MSSTPVGKLLCVGLRGARPGDAALEEDLRACRQAGVGAVILFDVDVPTLRRLQSEGVDAGSARQRATRNILDPDQLAGLVAHLRECLGPDLLVCIDQEGGEVARLSPRHGFAADPSAADFARLDPAARVRAARQQARRLRDLGLDLNFAPCVDLALEAANAVIVGNHRSFGAGPELVSEAAQTILDAHLQAGVASCLKHFPGHGSGRGDTHLGLVDITETWRAELELEPYRRLCGRDGVAVMMAHVVHRRLDPQWPASLSARIVGGLLREEIGFDGVVVTDSIDMRAIADRFAPGEAAVAAVEAGVDLVVDGFNLDERAGHPAPVLAAALQRAVDGGRIDASRIEASLRRLDVLRQQTGHPA